MSLENYRRDAKLWLGQAEDDVTAARTLAAAGNHAQACFLAQQAGEKALKAIWYFFGLEPWGHSLFNLIGEFPVESVRPSLDELTDAASALDKLYIPTRYPNGLPNMMPRDAYRANDSEAALAAATQVIQTAKELCNF